MICHYWFFNHGFKFRMLSVNISSIAIITIKNVDYCFIIHNISKYEETNLLKNYVLEDRWYIYKISVYLRELLFYFFCFAVYKIAESIDIFKY